MLSLKIRKPVVVVLGLFLASLVFTSNVRSQFSFSYDDRIDGIFSTAYQYISQRDYEACRQEISRLLNAYPQDFDVQKVGYFLIGLTYFWERNLQEAIPAFKECLSFADPQNDKDSYLIRRSNFYLGGSYMALKDYSQALSYLNNVVQLFPEEKDAVFALININHCYYKLGTPEAGWAYLKGLISTFKGKQIALAAEDLSIQNLARDGKFELALQKYGEIVAQFPGTERAGNSLYAMGSIYLYDLEDYASALEVFNRIVKEYPGTELMRLAKGHIEEIGMLRD